MQKCNYFILLKLNSIIICKFATMKQWMITLVMMLGAASMQAASDSLEIVALNKQRHFKRDVPAGNYSGIARMGEGNLYAVVSDKSEQEGFFVFEIEIDSISGDITHVHNLGFRTDGKKSRDTEGVAYLDASKTLMLANEADGSLEEYDLQGRRTGRSLDVGLTLKGWHGNYGLESLAYSKATGLLWTCAESTLKGDGPVATNLNGERNRIRLQSFDTSMKPQGQFAYMMDAPTAHKRAARFAHGVSELLALDDGSLLVLEREAYVSKRKIGSFVKNKIYHVRPDNSLSIKVGAPLDESVSFLDKTLIASWRTSISLLGRKWANFEGMCLGPRTIDGGQVIVLVSDSQNQQGGILRDWFKTIVVRIPQ